MLCQETANKKGLTDGRDMDILLKMVKATVEIFTPIRNEYLKASSLRCMYGFLI